MHRPLDEPMLQLVAQRLKVLADATRLRLLNELRSGERSVLDVAAAIDAGQPNTSRHLAVLHRAGLVDSRKVGRQVFYRVVDPFVDAICEAICGSLTSHVERQQQMVDMKSRTRTRRMSS